MNLILLVTLFVLLGSICSTHAVDKDIEIQGAGHLAGITLKLPTQWDFKQDSSDTGLNDRWFDRNPDDSWNKIDITRAWTVQAPVNDYRGIGWYHVRFTLPAEVEAGQEHLAYFHGLDGFADFYLDGIKIGEKKDNQDTWDEAFAVPFPSDLDPAVEHHFVVVPGPIVEDCDRIFGDHMAASVTWNGDSDINTPGGWPIYVHIRMRSAKLFALGWD